MRVDKKNANFTSINKNKAVNVLIVIFNVNQGLPFWLLNSSESLSGFSTKSDDFHLLIASLLRRKLLKFIEVE